ncbi:MAG: hypothetical protein ACLQBB_03735 [Solirubrobacteraceae bacterium]
MRSVQLQTALTAYVEAVADRLGVELQDGAEVPFDLVQQPRRGGFGGPALACYRPLTGHFLTERRAALEALPQHAEAAAALASFDGLDRYLRAVGLEPERLTRPARVSAALGSLLGEAFAEQSDFELRPERLRVALERLHTTALATSSQVTIVAALHGLTITSPELPLTGGLTIARPDALDGLPGGLLEGEDAGREHLVVLLRSDQQDPHQAVTEGREVLHDLLRALRLFGDGRVTLGALARARIGEGAWTPMPLGAGGRPYGMLVVTAEQEDELRAFCNLVSRRAPDGNELAWALRRFELGCERDDPFEALSDHLMALRALLEPEGPASAMLAGRLAALCATPERRAALTERTVQAIALERSAIAGSPAPRGALALARDVADHLRALLRDVICGHLDPDLAGLADELLLADVAPAPEPYSQTAGQGPYQAHRQPAPACSEPQLLGDAGEAEEILDLFI